LLLDYRAVGVDLIAPAIEVQYGKKLRSLALKVQVEPRNGQTGIKFFRGAHSNNNNNYTFKPRFDCQ